MRTWRWNVAMRSLELFTSALISLLYISHGTSASNTRVCVHLTYVPCFHEDRAQFRFQFLMLQSVHWKWEHDEGAMHVPQITTQLGANTCQCRSVTYKSSGSLQRVSPPGQWTEAADINSIDTYINHSMLLTNELMKVRGMKGHLTVGH